MRTPRKKVELKYNYPSPRWSGEILDCSMPMTFDQFSRCSYDCLYCFSYFQRSLKQFNPLFHNWEEDYVKVPPTAVSPEHMARIVNGDKKCQFTPYIEQRIPFQWGGLSDPFDVYEEKHEVGLRIMRAIGNYPVCFSTKGCWWVDDERYTKLFAHGNWNVKVSIINYDRTNASRIERGVPSPAERLDAIQKIAYFNPGEVTLRLRPFIIGLSDYNEEYLYLIEQASRMGATALSTEFLCIEGRAHEGNKKRYDAMSDVIGLDLLDFYRKNSPIAAGYLRLNYNIKRPYIERMEKLCQKVGMRFYVSDSDFKELSCNGSCCGLGRKWNYSRAQLTEVIVTARQRYNRFLQRHPEDTAGAENASRVTFAEFYLIAEKLYGGFRWRTALNFNTSSTMKRVKYQNMTMYDYIRFIWNSPKDRNSPYQYFNGLLKPIEKDSDGNLVYVFNPSRR